MFCVFNSGIATAEYCFTLPLAAASLLAWQAGVTVFLTFQNFNIKNSFKIGNSKLFISPSPSGRGLG